MKRIMKFAAIAAAVVLLLSMLTLTAGAEGTVSDGGETAPAEAVLAFVKRHLPALLSALTLCTTAVLARVFKASLLPLLERGMGRLDGGITAFTEEAKRLIDNARAQSERLSDCVRGLTEARERDAEREKELALRLGKLLAEQDALRKMGETELAMLKEVFTAARLPASSKMALESLYRAASESESEEGK